MTSLPPPATALEPIDLSACAQEPIHTPGHTQPHGVLLALDPHGRAIRTASANAGALLGIEAEALLGRPLDALLGPVEAAGAVMQALGATSAPLSQAHRPLTIQGREWVGVLHTSGGRIVLELEPQERGSHLSEVQIFALLRPVLDQLTQQQALAALLEVAAREVRALTGFDRVMIYRFDASWDGEVLAEARAEGMEESFLGLRFPASDIPPQARALYTRNWLRGVADVGAAAVALVSLDAEPLDMTHAVLRSVSPVHIEYLRNMGVASSTSISLVVDGQLWGLIACHHRQARRLPFDVRVACEIVGKVVSFEVGSLLRTAREQRLSVAREQQTRLLQQLPSPNQDPEESLAAAAAVLMPMLKASGLAFFRQARVDAFGTHPGPEALSEAWEVLPLSAQVPVWHTDRLVDVWPAAAGWPGRPAGLAGIWLSPGRGVVWLRPEQVEDVTWGGDPDKAVEAVEGGLRLSPRRSFAAWREQIRGRSAPWTALDEQVMQEVRHLLLQRLVDVVQHRERRLSAEVSQRTAELEQIASELRRSNVELERFAYITSHDLREPLRTITGFAELLEMEHADGMQHEAREYIRNIVQGSMRMRDMIQGLLELSRLSSRPLDCREVPLQDLLDAIQEDLARAIQDAGADIRVEGGALPVVWGDPTGLYSLLLNLVSNAIRFHAPGRHPHVTIRARAADHPAGWQIEVEDDGIGIDPRHHEAIFLVFRRLTLREEYEGLGLGLALCRRILDHHRGSITVRSAPGQGSTFTAFLPARPPASGSPASGSPASGSPVNGSPVNG